jgi:dTMP kinase
LANERTKSQSDFLPGSTAASRIDPESELRFERESLLFHQRGRDGDLKLAEEEPGRWMVLDGKEAPTTIAAAIWNRLENELAALRGK